MNGGHYHLWKKLTIDSKYFKVIELLVLVFGEIFLLMLSGYLILLINVGLVF
jgi:hypothetical protein